VTIWSYALTVFQNFSRTLFSAALVADSVLFKGQMLAAGRLKIDGPFVRIRIKHADGNDLAGERVEGEALFDPLLFFFVFSPL